ncbi:hypothetical protein V6N11_014395 [Hibiscus sabdariffa]|uniref:Uncharacterized protein n=1 Tax=Hibiscus sabdariffa TaxID=183260 RepID=A0ABR2NFK6_9ROSI
MSFGGFLDNSSGGGLGGARIVADIPFSNDMPQLVSPSLPKNIFNSPALSLGLQPSIDNQGDGVRMGQNFEASVGRRSREEEHESRSGSDNIDGISGDDQDAADTRPRKKRYHRHTPQQIRELEALFKECPHPDEKQRLELSKRLCLETRQTQLERHENSLLRQENDKLRAENMSIRDAMRNPICTNCGGPVIIGDTSLEEQHLRIENARLKEELDRVCALADKFLGRPISSLATSIAPPMPNSNLELGVGSNGFGGLSTVASTLPLGPDFIGGVTNTLPTTGLDRSAERSLYLELALAAMDELVKMAETDEPLWIKSLEGGREILNHDEYLRTFSPCIGTKPTGFVTEASRETGMVIINSMALVETLMDSNRWAEMFPCMIARTSTTDVISSGMGGTRNGAIQLMHAELQLLSPLVPVREINFLRFCKQHAQGVWAVVDVSIDNVRETSGTPAAFVNCRRLPSGCVVQDMPNGYSKRQCQCLAILMSSTLPTGDHNALSASGRRGMLKLAQRMTENFCAGVCASTVHKWNKLNAGNVDEDVRVMTRKSVEDPGEPPGIVLSAATSVWLAVTPQRLFDFLRDEGLRSEWDILSNGGPMQEIARIPKGQDHGTCVSLLRSSAMIPSQNSMLILQETCIDAAGSLVVYAPVDITAMHVVMNGGDSSYVALLPSGFAIIPDCPGPNSNGRLGGVGGSLLTVAFQILVNSLPTAKLTVESVETVNNLISCTVQKIKAALQCES